MAEPAVTFLLEQVNEVVQGYTDLISGAENEFKLLQNVLKLLVAFLKDAGNMSKQKNLFRELERQIRDVVYEVEDSIDTCLTKAIEAKAKSSRRNLVFQKYNLAKEVKSIREDKVLPMFTDAKLKFATMQIADGSGGVEDYPWTTLKRDQLRPSTDETKKEWEVVGENVSRAIKKEQRIGDAVELSYHRLPDDLRECFVYMGVFPEDYEIPAKMLMWLWIAEGFIQPKDGKSFEQCAEDNLKDLIGRNLLKAEQTNHMGRVKTCRVHDMIRAFCIARSDEEILFQEVKKSNATGAFDPPVSENSHRLCIHSHLSEFLSENPKGPRVRSFLCFYEQPVYLAPRFINVIPDGFPKLRVMDSKSIIFHQYPAKVAKLIHLRYITLFIENPTNPGQQTNLPKEISELWNLQTLVVQTKSRTIEVKANIWRMIRLRHLKTTAAIVLLDNKFEGEGGQNLQTLNRLSPESCTEVVSEKAKNLKTLGICGKLANVFGIKFLEKLQCLEKLKLANSLTYEAASEDPLSLPQSNCFPPYLRRLTLVGTFLQWENMSTLAEIKTLEVLKLKDNAFAGVYWDAGGYCFRYLQALLILNADLVIWEATSESFPRLRCLVLKNCENVKEIPEALAQTLEKLEIERVRESAVASARKIFEQKQQEYEKDKPRVPLHLSLGPGCSYK